MLKGGITLINPWEQINLDIYETHMKSDNVFQLQTLNLITKQQISRTDNTNIAILGVAGGNGLCNIDITKTRKVYGIDVNREYLEICKKRYPKLSNVLELICCDLSNPNTILPFSDILICNLIIEYLGVAGFTDLIINNKENINVISCVIQENNNNDFVSSSGLSSAFSPLLSIHNDIDGAELIKSLLKVGFHCTKNSRYPLPNGKNFVQMDFK